MRLLVFGSGRGSNFQAIHRSILKNELDAEVVAVISDVHDAAIIEYAKNNDINTIVVDNSGKERHEYERLIIDNIHDLNYDLVILAGYMRILSSEFIRSLKMPILNIHPSILPSFPGLNAQKQAFEYGVKITGCTVHLVNEIVDGGKILAQRCVEVKNNDTVDSLSARILEQEHIIYTKTIREIIQGKITLNMQKI